ncbi:MAG: MFS transporter [Lutibacter sp.]
MYNKGLFADWVPKPIQLLLIIVFLLPILVVSGIYTGNLSFMVGSLGTQNEWIVFANYAGVVGMGVSLPIIFRYKLRFHTKFLMVRTLIFLALASFMLGTTDHNIVMVSCAFFIGFLKMFALIELIMPVMFILSPKGDRPRFYSIFYPMAIIVPQIAGYLMTRVGFDTYWQNANYIMAIIMLVLAALALIFMHNKRFDRKVPLYYVDWTGMFLYTIVFLAMAYVIAFSKQQNYFQSDNIMLATGVVIVGIILYQINQRLTKRPFVNFGSLKNYNVVHGIMMLFMLGFFLAGSSLQSKITIGVLGFDTVMDNSYNLWMIPGLVLASIFSLKWLGNDKSLKIYLLTGFSAFICYYLFMYFLVSANVSYEQLIIPNMLRGFGMGVLFIGVWLYALNNLSVDATLGAAAVLIIIRTMIGPGVWSLIFNYFDGIWSLEALTNMAGKMDASAYSKETAMGLYRNLNLDAMMISIKRIYGVLILLGMAILVYVSFLHLEGLEKRKIVLLRKQLKGQDTKGYKHEVKHQEDNEIKEEATAASAAAI